jgi:protein-S-isoprenylcysteine O-methyltransferase Ste14
MIEALVLTGWGAHLLHWVHALAAARRAAAHPAEWVRELAVRAAMLLAVLAGVIAGPGGHVAFRPAAVAAAALLFLTGHAIAITGRSTLGRAWSIGTRPRPGGERQRSGLYAAVRHPIYAGVLLALLMQLLLLQNVASAALLLGAAIVVPAKVRAEERWLARQQGTPTDQRTPSGGTST